jgi:putative ATP-dependent endonuclease of OLD family
VEVSDWNDLNSNNPQKLGEFIGFGVVLHVRGEMVPATQQLIAQQTSMSEWFGLTRGAFMRIHTLIVHNYRSIVDLSLHCDNLQILLGPNNHGKSNVLACVEFFLTVASKPTISDFCSLRKQGDDELWVEAHLIDLTDQEATTLKKYLDANRCVRIRKVARVEATGTVEVGYHGYVTEPKDWWLQGSAIERFKTKELLVGEAAAVPALRLLSEEQAKLTKDRLGAFQAEYIQQHKNDLEFVIRLEDSPLLGLKSVAAGVLPDFYMVPAVRDLSDEVKTQGTTAFARLLQRAVREMSQTDPAYAEIRARLEALTGAFNSDSSSAAQSTPLRKIEQAVTEELSAWGVTAQIEVLPPDMEQLFELGTDLHLNDGIKTKASEKGHGLQRAAIFALMRSWAKVIRQGKSGETSIAPRKASDSIVFAFEEPELFLHPQAQRRLVASLSAIAEAPQHQVFMCTHSSHFLDLTRYKSIATISKPGPRCGTTVKQCLAELFDEGLANRKRHFQLANWINPDRGELFFAKKVILVEGDTEAAVVPYLAQRLGCYDPEISIINCGSKFNLHLYIRLLEAFKLPYMVLHDEDPLPDPIPVDWKADKLRECGKTFALNQEIKDQVISAFGFVDMFRPDFEGLVGVSQGQASKKGKPLAALDYLEATPDALLDERVKTLVTTAYKVAN